MKTGKIAPKVNKGDIVVVEALGITVKGKVVYADYDDSMSCWDIEMTEANVKGGYSHWKQQFDGGELISINEIPVK